MSEEYDPLTEDLIEQLFARRAYRWVHAISQTPKADGLVQDVLCQKSALALQAQAAEIAELKTANKQIFEQARLMYAENEALRAWKASRLLHEGCNGHMRGDPPAYVPECVSLRADAERYQQLRRGQKWSVINGIGDVLRGDDLDSAVDAARGTTRNVTALESLRAWNAETDPDVASALDDLTKSRGAT